MQEKKNETIFNMHNYSHSQDEVTDLDEIVARVQNYNISKSIHGQRRNNNLKFDEIRVGRKQYASSTFFKLIPIQGNANEDKQNKKRLTFQQILNHEEKFNQNDFVEQLV